MLNSTPEVGINALTSILSSVVQALPESEKNLLRHGAVLPYVTLPLARAATGNDADAQQLVKHPLLEKTTSRTDTVWKMSLPLRRQLLDGWQEEAATVLKRVADESAESEPVYGRLYARLASPYTREEALAEFEEEFQASLDPEGPDIARAHDLLRLLDEWPLDRDEVAKSLRQSLAPRLHRFARAARDREATSSYLPRAFEEPAVGILLDDSPQWMLQIHAPGGRGKTMFLRNLLGRFCPRRSIAAARIDFDYVVHLAIVTQQPWRLLLSIARQLDGQLEHAPFSFMLNSYGSFQAPIFSEALPRRKTGEIDDAWLNDSLATTAAQEVPRKFRTELARCLADRSVIVVLDTVESVLLTPQADLTALITALAEVRSGAPDDDEDDARVPGLKLVLCGRFDLEGTQAAADGTRAPRTRAFKETWIGPDAEVRLEPAGATDLRIGREVVSVELPGFSEAESKRYLTEFCGLGENFDGELLTAIIDRCDGHPMKLALCAEYLRSDPDLTVADFAAFDSFELFILVDRVVDRIEDGRVQWLLRWGVLPHVLTLEFVETVIWPELVRFAETRSDYDAPDKDDLPASPHEVTRWKIPDPETLRAAGAARAAWNELLKYAAKASWVSEADDLAEAVVFHPDVRDPLRRLLNKGGHPAYHDILQRAFDYWIKRAEQTEGTARSSALRNAMRIAFLPGMVDGTTATLDWRDLLERAEDDRSLRGELAAELLSIAQAANGDLGHPRASDIALAHLERAESLVHDAVQKRRPINEAELAPDVAAAEGVEDSSSSPMPALIQLREGDAAAFAEQSGARVPAFFTNPGASEYLAGTKYCTALVDQNFIASLQGDSLVSRITVLPPVDPRSVPKDRGEPPHLKPASGEPVPGIVVVGVIDYGIAFAHERFRLKQHETRIEYFWVQDAPCGEGAGQPGSRELVNPVPYGREINRDQIDDLLAGHANNGFVDEDILYRRAADQLGQHWHRSVSRRVAHGTHVMDLACGYDPADQEGKKRPIVCVQLPEPTTADTSGENLDAYALDGIRYILDRADAIARRKGWASLPVVINFSFGNVAGPHDGTSDLEDAIDELIDAHPNLNVVIPSGNSHLGRLHAEFAFDRPGQIVDLHWRVLPDDRTPSFLEIWLPLQAWLPGVEPEDKVSRRRAQIDPEKRASPINLRIAAPGDSSEGELEGATPGDGLRLLADNGDGLCEARYHFIGAPTNRGMFLIALQPTRRVDPRPGTPANPVAPSGAWTITLENVSLKPRGLVEAWIQRDDTPYGFPRRGRQSYFDHACYQRFDHGGRLIEHDSEQGPCIIKRAGSMNAIATGKRTFIVGGYVRRSGEPAEYSAGGPLAHRWPRRGPDAMAVSDESRVLCGVLAAGTRSGSVVALNGTSVAAPQAARMKADEVAGSGRARAPEHRSDEEGEPQPEVEPTRGKRIERLRVGR